MAEVSATEDRREAASSDEKPAAQSASHPVQFWIIIASLSLLAFVSALDAMIVTTALPTITQDIGGATQYVWIANSFVIASTVLQPLVGQLANIFGRKYPTVVSTALFMISSGHRWWSLQSRNVNCGPLYSGSWCRWHVCPD